MADLNLPIDLVAFLREGKELDYDSSTCDVGAITLVPEDQLKFEFFPMWDAGKKDPHVEDPGCYMVSAVSLIATCDNGRPDGMFNYDPHGLFLWLLLDEQYGYRDGEHGFLMVLGKNVNWTQIAEGIPKYFKSHYDLRKSNLVTDLIPYPKHSYNPAQFHEPLPNLEEWYEAEWTRRGVHRDVVQLRYPEEIRIRVERDGDRSEVTSWIKEAKLDSELSEGKTQEFPAMDWMKVQSRLAADFWDQPHFAPDGPADEPEIFWRFSGFRSGQYRTLFRTFTEESAEGSAEYELGI